MMIGIELTGKDYAPIGVSEEESDKQLDDRLEFVESFGLLGGGCLLSEDKVSFSCSREDDKDVTLPMYKRFMKGYRSAFPTFDGMIYLLDLDHLPSKDMKLVDAFVKYANTLDDDGNPLNP